MNSPNHRFVLAASLIVLIAAIIFFSEAQPTGFAVSEAVLDKGLGSFLDSIDLYYKDLNDVTKITVKATVGGRWCSSETEASIRNSKGSEITYIKLPSVSAGSTATATKSFNDLDGVSKIVVKDAGGLGSCQYVDYAEATVTYLNDPPIITSFKATPTTGTGDTTATFSAAASDDEANPLTFKIYFDTNNAQADAIKTVQITPPERGQPVSVDFGAYKYSAPQTGAKTYTARLEVSDGKNPAVRQDIKLTINSINQPPADTTLPVVSVSHSPDAPNINQIVTITATATDNVGVSSVDIFVDSNLVKTCQTQTCAYSTSYTSAGTHTYYASAKDTATPSNVGKSETKSFTVVSSTSGGGGQQQQGGGGSSSTCTWSAQNSGTRSNVFDIYFVDANTGFAVGGIKGVTDNVIYLKSTDGGKTWANQISKFPYMQVSAHYISAISFADTNTGWLLDNSGAIYKTKDGGITWTEEGGLQVVGSTPAVNLYFVNRNIGWAVGGGGLIAKTDNGGETVPPNYVSSFGLQGTFGADYSFETVYFTDQGTGWIGGNKGIFKTIDGGTTWLQQYSYGTISGIYFINANSGWAVGSGGKVLKTTDGGKTWTPITSGTNSRLTDVYFVDTNTGWAVGDGGVILKTIDGGNTWAKQTSSTTSALYSVQFVDANTGWAVGASGTILKCTTQTGSGGGGRGGGATTYRISVHKKGTGSGTITSATPYSSAINCGTQCSANLAQGQTLTLTATPNSGSVFGGWSGACSGTSTSCTVKADSNKDINANFNALDVTVKGTLTYACTNVPLGSYEVLFDNQRYLTDANGKYSIATSAGVHTLQINMLYNSGYLLFTGPINFIGQVKENLNLQSRQTSTRDYAFEINRGLKIITNVDKVVIPYVSGDELDCRAGCGIAPLGLGQNSFEVRYGDQKKVATANVERCKITDVNVNFP